MAADHSFLYPFLAERTPGNPVRVLEAVRISAIEKCRDVARLRREFIAEQEDALVATALAMADRFRAGGRLLTFGCGGSATDALDAAHDFAYSSPPLPALALVADTAIITAVGNDVGFDKVFLRQVIAYGRLGDIAMGISTSGNSASLLEAFREAGRRDMLTVGILGYDGGAAAASGLLDHSLVVRSDYVPRIQEAQATIYHSLREIVRSML